MYALGIDIGGTHLRMGLVDQNYDLHAFEKHSIHVLSNDPSPIAKLASIIQLYLHRHAAEQQTFAITLGFPATVDKQGERVLSAPNLRGFDGVNVKRELAKLLPYRITVEKDVNLLLLCDLYRSRSRAKDIVACYVGTGLGNAIMLGGKLMRGSHGVAGELGHIPFGDTEEPCGCGNLGCAEGLVAGKQLVTLCDTHFPTTHVSALFTKHADHPVLRTYLDRLSRVIASEINILDPELLILGGGVVCMQDFPREALCQQIRKYVRKPLPHDQLDVVFSDGSDTCGVIGGGIRAWKKKR